MRSFFEQIYYGNRVMQWVLALAIITLSVIIGRMLYWFIGKRVKVLTQRTKSNFDDIIVDMLEEPVVGFLILGGFWYALSVLTLSAGSITFVKGAFNLVIALLSGWLLIRLYEAIHVTYLQKLVTRTTSQLDDQILPMIRSGVRFIVFALAIIIGLNNAGYDVGAVLAGLGLGGLAFALAAQDTVANIFGGVTILLLRPFAAGDRIRVADVEGYIRQLGIRSSLLETLSGEKIWLPNSKFTSNPIYNLDNCAYYIDENKYPLHRDTAAEAIEQIIPLLEAVAKSNPHLVWSQAILNTISTQEFEIKLIYGIKPWQPDTPFANHLQKKMAVKHDINVGALKLIRQQNIHLATPTFGLYQDSRSVPLPAPVTVESSLPKAELHN